MNSIKKKLTAAFIGTALAASTTAEAAEKKFGAICYGRGASASIGGFDNKIYGFGIEFSANEKGKVTRFNLLAGTEPTPELRVIDQMCKAVPESCEATFHGSILNIQAASIIRGAFSASIINGNYAGHISEVNKRTGKYQQTLWGIAKCELGPIKPGY